MGVEAILAGCVLLAKLAEESALVCAVDLGVYLAHSDRDIDLAVVPGVRRGDGDLSGFEFDVLVAYDVLHGDLSGGHLKVEVHLAWDLDADLHAVVFEAEAGDGEGGVRGRAGELEMGVQGGFGVLILGGGLAGDVDRLLIGGDDLDACGAGVDGQGRA